MGRHGSKNYLIANLPLKPCKAQPIRLVNNARFRPARSGKKMRALARARNFGQEEPQEKENHMLSILNNVASMAAQNQMSITNTNMQKTLEQLSSGQRINSGADDAAGLSIADGLNANVAALNQSSQNATTGVGLLQVADGALAQVTSLLNRAVTLATEAANSGLTADQHTALNNEFTSIKTEIDNIGQTTTYNGSAIFGGGAGGGSTQATNPNTLVSSAIGASATAANGYTVSGTLAVDAGGKLYTFVSGGGTLGNFVNTINSQSDTAGDGIQASVNSSGKLVVTDNLDRGNISLDATNTFQADVNGGAAATPTFANQGLNNMNVLDGAFGVSANTVVNPTSTGNNPLPTSGSSNVFSNALGTLSGGSNATFGSGVLTLTADPTANDTIKIGGTTYTFKAAGTNGPGDVTIDVGNEKGTLQNLANAINGKDGFNTANANVSAAAAGGTAGTGTLTITATVAGVAGATAADTGNANNSTGAVLGWTTAFNSVAAVDATAATGSLTLTDAANLKAGSSVTIGQTTYNFVSSMTGAPAASQASTWVQIGATTADTISNLISAITSNNNGAVDTSVSAAVQNGNPDKVNFTANVANLTGGLAGTSGSALAMTGSLTSAVVPGAAENLIVTAGTTTNKFVVNVGDTVSDVINTINNQGTGISASLDTSTGKVVLTDTQDNGDIAVTDDVNGALVNNLSGETLGGSPLGVQTNGFAGNNPALMTSSNTMSIFLSDSTQTGTSTVNVALNTFNSSNLGVAGAGIANNDLTTTADAATALTSINAAISNVSALRGNLGAGVNQLQAATNVISSQTQNLTTASSNITSADVSQTVADMTKYSILSQTGMAAMAQANAMQKGILTLLQG